jgi:predicted transcriptional regulator
MKLRWDEVKKKKVPAKRLAEIEALAKHHANELSLRELREMTGKTQVQLAQVTHIAQSELSRLERRDDCLVSTLRRYVEALGGELEVTAVFGDQRIRVRELE